MTFNFCLIIQTNMFGRQDCCSCVRDMKTKSPTFHLVPSNWQRQDFNSHPCNLKHLLAQCPDFQNTDNSIYLIASNHFLILLLTLAAL